MKFDKNNIKDLSFIKEGYSKTRMDEFLTHYLEDNMENLVDYFNKYTISDYGEEVFFKYKSDKFPNCPYVVGIVTGKQIGRASCRERVSSPV